MNYETKWKLATCLNAMICIAGGILIQRIADSATAVVASGPPARGSLAFTPHECVCP